MFPANLKGAPDLAFFAKLGVERTTAKATYSVPGFPYEIKVSDTSLTAGGGAQYSFNKNFSVRGGLDIAGEADALYIAGIFKF